MGEREKERSEEREREQKKVHEIVRVLEGELVVMRCCRLEN